MSAVDQPQYSQLCRACEDGDIDKAMSLIPLVDLTTNRNDHSPLAWAARRGHMDLVNLLIPLTPQELINSSFDMALSGEKANVIERILNEIQGEDACTSALREMICRGVAGQPEQERWVHQMAMRADVVDALTQWISEKSSSSFNRGAVERAARTAFLLFPMLSPMEQRRVLKYAAYPETRDILMAAPGMAELLAKSEMEGAVKDSASRAGNTAGRKI